uniref:sugar phosphate isomerase/epimerase family protein n=1 Tax=Pedobacter schmidteae TaxID=2201271 RepID=UPI000EAF3568|nr:sugar phosphate isomerase/epimerase family protein [Pedobacter schmidteae]
MKVKYLFFLLLITVGYSCTFAASTMEIKPKPLKIGYSISIVSLTPEKMQYAKSVGVDYVEVSLSAFLDKSANFNLTSEQIIEKVTAAKKAADEAGIRIWSIHMPFSKDIDLSLVDEDARNKVVALHTTMLKYCKILQPQVILFHPSYFLGLNERELRKKQLIKSAVALNKQVKSIKAIMVIENMLGPELQIAKRERPLCRTVEETLEIMNRMPASIYSAIDMNHIKNPENLIRAMGRRLKTVHIADGTGKKEDHFFPCSGEGQNNWTAILSALNEVGYSGPFMYESKHKDVKDLKICYDTLYQNFVNAQTSDRSDLR